MKLRRATADDCRMVWEWANDPDVRAVSFSSDPIPYPDHERWFQRQLSNDGVVFYIAENNDTPIGQLRFELDNEDAVISISLAAEARGKGLGTTLLSAGCEQLFNQSDAKTIHAYIKPGNTASERAFLNVGFEPQSGTVMRGEPAVHLLLRRAV